MPADVGSLTKEEDKARKCDGCTECCTALGVQGVTKGTRHPINKAPGTPCVFCSDSGCAVWDTRPDPCRAFDCEYLRDQDGRVFKDKHRPDRCGLVVRHHADAQGFDRLIVYEMREGVWSSQIAEELFSKLKRHAKIQVHKGDGRTETHTRDCTHPTRAGGYLITTDMYI